MRVFWGLGLLFLLQACKHPLAIIGEGDIIDLNGGSRGCSLEQFQAVDTACTENEVTADYFVNYQAVPRPGWRFVGWEGPCGHLSVFPTCRIDTVAGLVTIWDDQYSHIVIPPTTAIFEEFIGDASYAGNGVVSESGGEITLGAARLTVRPSDVLNSIDVGISETSTPQSLPGGLQMVGSAFEFSISDAQKNQINGPFNITLSYDESAFVDEKNLIPILYTGEEYKPVRVLSHDTLGNTVSFESRADIAFVLTEMTGGLPAVVDTGFWPATDGWDIENFGAYFTPGANSLGMSGYAAWYYQNYSDGLNQQFSDDVSEILSVRTQLAQSQTWHVAQWHTSQTLHPSKLGRLMRAYLHFTNEPLLLLMGTDGKAALAAVVIGYDTTGFQFYDVRHKNEIQTLSFSGGNFGSYDGHNSFGYAALASLGRDQDFEDLTTEALAGFPGTVNLRPFTPQNGEDIQARVDSLIGSVTGDLSNESKLYVNVKGFSRHIPVKFGTFTNPVEISNGPASIIILAGVDTANQSNWYKGSVTSVTHINGEPPPAKLLTTLTWEQDSIDLDLYVTDPNGETAWYTNPQTSSGLSLDIEDDEGYGPEHISLSTSAGGQVLPGNYTIKVHYRSSQAASQVASGA
ncbi:MAG: hypothetical protein ACI9GW_002776, partial [Halieaceae bacterium]